MVDKLCIQLVKAVSTEQQGSGDNGQEQQHQQQQQQHVGAAPKWQACSRLLQDLLVLRKLDAAQNSPPPCTLAMNCCPGIHCTAGCRPEKHGDWPDVHSWSPPISNNGGCLNPGATWAGMQYPPHQPPTPTSSVCMSHAPLQITVCT